MTSETLATLNDLLHQMKVVQDGFRLNPTQEGQFAARIVGQSMNFMDMHCQNEYGVKLYPLARKAEVDAEVVAEIKEVVKKAPKAKK